jgi:hypothetical protein
LQAQRTKGEQMENQNQEPNQVAGLVKKIIQRLQQLAITNEVESDSDCPVGADILRTSRETKEKMNMYWLMK